MPGKGFVMAPFEHVFGVLDRIRSADITVYPHRCVVVRNRNASCRRCAEACTAGALSIVDNGLTVEPDRCIGCGTCATACPTCALEAHHPTDDMLGRALFEAAQANGGVAVMACRPMVERGAQRLDCDRLVGVECLGRAHEGLFVSMAAAGISRVVLVHGSCESCPLDCGGAVARSVQETTQALLEVWESDCKIVWADRFPASVRAAGEAVDADRRRFFFQMGDGVARVAAAATEEALAPALADVGAEEPSVLKVMDDGTLPHFIPDRREMLLDCLADLGQPRDELVATRLWGHVMVDREQCVSCRMCATFCPTGAIAKFDETDGSLGVLHRPADCVKCRCCEDVCPIDALALSDEVFARDLIDGSVERIDMDAPAIDQADSKKVVWTMRDLLGCDDIFER